MTMIRDFYIKYKQLIDKTIFLAVFAAIALVSVRFLFPLTAPFLFGMLISFMLEPIVRILNRRFKIPRGACGFLLLILLIIVVILLGTAAVSRIISESTKLYADLPRYAEEGTRFFENLDEKYNMLLEFVPREVANGIDSAISETRIYLTTALIDILGRFIGQSGINAIKSLPQTIIGIVVCLLSAFFFIKDRELIADSIGKLMPKKLTQNAAQIWKGLAHTLTGYFKAQLIIMSVVGTVLLLGLAILDYPYALILSLVIAFVDALPVLGSGLFLWPWAVFNFATGNYFFAIGLLVIYACVFFTRQILEPKILSMNIGIHPLMMLISVFIGLRLFGLWGFIIGPFIVIIVKSVIITMDSDSDSK